jgi:lysophospholipase L1-like esterase
MSSAFSTEQPGYKSWHKKIHLQVLLLLFSLIICSLTAEAVLRLFPSLYHGLNLYTAPYRIQYDYPKKLFLADKILGHRYQPRFKGFFSGQGYEHIPIQINSMGFRDREYSLNKPAGVFRVLGLGDSITFGAGVKVGDTYLKQLEKLLNHRKEEVKYEVINAGINRYDNLQELRLLKELAPKLHPDLVVIGVCINDIYGVPHKYKVPARNQAVKNKACAHTIIHKLICNLRKQSKFVDLAIKLYRNSRVALHAANYLREYLRSCYRRWEGEDWGLLQKQLLEFKSIADEQGFQIVFVLFPTEIQLHFTQQEAVPQLKFVEFAQAHEFLYLDLFRSFKENGLSTKKPLFLEKDDLHPNAEGHKLIAETTYNFLSSNNLLKLVE